MFTSSRKRDCDGVNRCDILNLEEDLSRLLGVKVHLVERQALKPSIREHVLQEVTPVL